VTAAASLLSAGSLSAAAEAAAASLAPPASAAGIAKPDDEFWAGGWFSNDGSGTDNSYYAGLWFLDRIGAPQAWNMTTGSRQVGGERSSSGRELGLAAGCKLPLSWLLGCK